MKILVRCDDNFEQTVFWINYLRDIWPALMRDVILIDLSHSGTTRKWASEQEDFTYIYFEEDVACGSAFNQVIEGLMIDDDILITDCYHIPLTECYERMQTDLYKKEDIFAVGPVSNSFSWEQNIAWDNAEEALNWSEACTDDIPEEVLILNPGVIMFGRKVVEPDRTFDDEAKDISSMIVEKLIREFLDHYRMYVCKNSGCWDIRGNEYVDNAYPDTCLLEKRFKIHYLNVRGNFHMLKLLKECEWLSDDIRVLEIGCDCGGSLFDIKKIFKNAKLYGTDINENSLRYASEFAEVRVNNIEDHNLDFGTNDFDIIIFADVLEHLRDPLKTLEYCKKLLKKDGCIVASIPNLMNIEVMKHLLNGDFPYSDYGLLDRTHIHMFTFNEIVRMFENQAGYKIEKLTLNGMLSEKDEQLAEKLLKLGRAEKFMYQAFQYQVVARKKG